MCLFELFLISVIIQLFYYFFFFSRLSFSNRSKAQKTNIPISVIICAKNEVENLLNFLPLISAQIYCNFEIILVNDHSSDNTLEVMQSFVKQTNNATIINLSQNNSGNKKKAVTHGIQAAKHPFLLFTDADCKPNSKYWIEEMAMQFSDQKKIILGYGAYQKIKKSWLNKLIRFETLLTAIQYFSYAKSNLAYMGVGRNLAYTKKIFNQVNGFSKHQHIKSGDDDLFINQVAKNNNVACSISPNSFTISKPHTSFTKWLYQKRRHITTANVYKTKHKLLLGMFFLSQFIFWFLGIYLLVSNINTPLVLSLIILRLFFQYFFYGLSANKLQETDLILYIPILELFLIIVQLTILIQNILFKPTKWQI